MDLHERVLQMESTGVKMDSLISVPPGKSQAVELPSGLRLHYRTWGIGKRVCILLHGTGDGSYVWPEATKILMREFKLIALDMRGHGDSSWDKDRKYSMGAYVADVQYLIDSLGINACFLIGHSFGAAVALKLAKSKIVQTLGLVFVDFGPGMDRASRAFARKSFLEQFRVFSAVSDYAVYLRERRPLASPSTLEFIAVNAMRPCEPSGFILKCDPAVGDEELELTDTELLKAVRGVSCPTMLVRGRASALLPVPWAKTMVDAMAQGKFCSIERAGHAVMTDNPRDFGNAVYSFLRGC